MFHCEGEIYKYEQCQAQLFLSSVFCFGVKCLNIPSPFSLPLNLITSIELRLKKRIMTVITWKEKDCSKKISIRLKKSATWKMSFSSRFQCSCIMDSLLVDGFSGSTVNVVVTLEREDEVTGPVIAPFFPQVSDDTVWQLQTGREVLHRLTSLGSLLFIYTAVVWFALAFHWSWIIKWEIALRLRPYRKDVFLHCNIVRVIVKERASGLLCTIKYIRSKSDKIKD